MKWQQNSNKIVIYSALTTERVETAMVKVSMKYRFYVYKYREAVKKMGEQDQAYHNWL